jgi:hypothetical protein
VLAARTSRGRRGVGEEEGEEDNGAANNQKR